MTLEELAEHAHEVNRAYCEALGDTSQVAWKDAPEWQRTSAINGVRAHLTTVPRITPEQSHELWLKEKLKAGWVYGAVKDPAKKEHPCCVPFAELPVDQKAKDFIFRAVCERLGKYL